MSPIMYMVAFALTIAILAGVFAYFFHVHPWKRLTKRRVVVQISGGSAFQGVLAWRSRELLALDDVSILVGDEPQRMDGRVILERAQIQFVQVL